MSNDLRRTHPGLYSAPDVPVRLTVPPLTYLAIDGAGDPNSAPEYSDAVSTLYALSYGARGAVKKAGGEMWTVMPLEGLWWSDDIATFSVERREEWRWTMLIAQPPVVDDALVADALAAAVRRGRAPSADRVRLEVVDEGDAFQVMHHGPYADEGPTIAHLHEAIIAAGCELTGKHHEIYLNDPRRVAPESVRTILRQPVTPT